MYSVYKVQYPIWVLYVLHSGCSRAPSADSVSMYSVKQPLVIASARILHSVAPYSPSRILKRHLSHGYILPWPVADLKIVTWGFLLRLQLHSKEYGSVGEGSWNKKTDRSEYSDSIGIGTMYIVGCSQQSPPRVHYVYKTWRYRPLPMMAWPNPILPVVMMI